MKYILSFFIALLTVFTISAQDSINFPDDYLGVYDGNLVIHSAGKTQNIPMEFHLLKTKSTGKYQYKLVYNGQERNYTLVVKDKEKGLFEVDENNGVVLPFKFVSNTLYSFFEVQGNLLTTRLAFNDDTVDFEILFTKSKNKTTTGKGTKEIPFVYGYPVTVTQRALLKRK
ncbi:hypothetical protein SAMN04489761_4346 [Tenacibaculum sp. MAR_2009_124]|uniref:hypothetical protein n=1 Tax=Tenacibaculum sp. MAR_2009_124 TaxID=1250059 RepID=UPI000898C632|nr:hypothetical protein [Tenacibaculum sp. MAR_2009_124]SED12389.1 hypothetical protein SAMN04489761_4346 [Tenacibaculum sp. MAR_2009_124]